jgi:hypothetical protein
MVTWDHGGTPRTTTAAVISVREQFRDDARDSELNPAQERKSGWLEGKATEGFEPPYAALQAAA